MSDFNDFFYLKQYINIHSHTVEKCLSSAFTTKIMCDRYERKVWLFPNQDIGMTLGENVLNFDSPKETVDFYRYIIEEIIFKKFSDENDYLFYEYIEKRKESYCGSYPLNQIVLFVNKKLMSEVDWAVANLDVSYEYPHMRQIGGIVFNECNGKWFYRNSLAMASDNDFTYAMRVNIESKTLPTLYDNEYSLLIPIFNGTYGNVRKFPEKIVDAYYLAVKRKYEELGRISSSFKGILDGIPDSVKLMNEI